MGMYDYVICRYPLPTLPPAFVKSGDHQYQSKSLDCQMALYEIRDNGTLWLEDYDIEDQSDLAKWKTAHPGEELPKELTDHPLSGLAGCMSRVNRRWVQIPSFNGTVEFYDGNACVGAYGHSFTPNGEDREWVCYEAVFVNGALQQIRETEREHEPALSSEVYHKLDDMFPGDGPVIDMSEPEVGAEMYVLWDSIDRNRQGYPAKLIAKTERDWAFSVEHGKIETIDPHQLGNCLFHSEVDAKAQRSWEHLVWDRKTEYCKGLIQANLKTEV
jgi:hypothetical protein